MNLVPGPENSLLAISGSDGEVLVRVHYDGTLEYGPGYEPDVAARTFWEAIAAHVPRAGQDA